MRPLTDIKPKPLIEVEGRSLIDRIIDHLCRAHVNRFIINTHYKGSMIEDHLRRTRPDLNLIFSHEETLLDTGGGFVHALEKVSLPDDSPVFAVNGDALWHDPDDHGLLDHMSSYWDADKMDMLHALQPTDSMKITKAVGDYNRAETGRLTRRMDRGGRYMFAGIRICTPACVSGKHAVPFSFLEVFDEIEKKGRLYGLPHQGEWYNVSTKADIDSIHMSGHFKK